MYRQTCTEMPAKWAFNSADISSLENFRPRNREINEKMEITKNAFLDFRVIITEIWGKRSFPPAGMSAELNAQSEWLYLNETAQSNDLNHHEMSH